MKTMITVTLLVMAIAQESYACEGGKMVTGQENVETIKSEELDSSQKNVPIAVNKETFFCAGTSFVLIAPNINEFSRLAQPTVLRSDINDCSKYDEAYFEKIYKEIVDQGGLLFNSYLSVDTERVTASDGSQTCQKVLSEVLDLVPQATCLIHQEKIVLEKLPLSACNP